MKTRFEVDATNNIYKVNVNTYFKILNNVKSYTLLDTLTLNHDHKMDSIHFIWNTEDPIPFKPGLVRGRRPRGLSDKFWEKITFQQEKKFGIQPLLVRSKRGSWAPF
jgi:hypothetical protein